ncbi:ribosomal protein L24 [Acrasis kona]|uniref:Ribosomal protein L24 n=1 Tax=Acrasis kona TaxID=1008807 RepID=A0AAW2Z0I3_9EUKA
MPHLHPKVLKNNLVSKFRIVRGDLVEILCGRDKGKQGIVSAVLRKKNRVIVEGCMLQRRKIKAQSGKKGYMIMSESSIHYSNVLLVDPVKGIPTKTNYKFTEDGKKVRVTKVSGTVVPKPSWTQFRKEQKVYPDTDTAPADVVQKTYTRGEVLELKNRFLRMMELDHYQELKAQYEEFQKNKARQLYDQKVFEKQVYERAQQFLRDRNLM